MTLPRLLRRFITDKHGHIVLGQRPNAPLIIWAVFTVIAHILHTGHLRSGAYFISAAALLIWAFLEVIRGASPARRVLGAVVLLFMVFRLLF